ncbi:CRAL-TRIO domain-containing protein [Rhodofomes roseus]|uniref:CRAL-TRIO domain-containing protein n=1 Tax=Rhodofomes roseus TaxID=34475 RepID=A0ABQ8KQ90_9APHY|nr:CRAL-TRIO domain-containing protein [Rhodofomes roseus]KAH9840527.1 CRAL-TRIO domain-containing protein [Rhodofomes roseus]
MSEPSPKEQEVILEQLRAQLVKQDLMHEGDTIGTDDFTLLRFLRARGYDVKASVEMWAKCQEWRKTMDGVGIDELYTKMDAYDFPERREVFEYWPMWFHKTDKEGRPVSIQHYGAVNIPELYKHITPERFWWYVVTMAESIPREIIPTASRAAGHQVDGTFLIVDLKGYSLGQFWQMKDLVRAAFQIMQDYYPELSAKFFIINAPWSFTTIWSLLKLWLAPRTIEKMDVLGGDYQAVLLKHVDAENLPAFYGGTSCNEYLQQ